MEIPYQEYHRKRLNFLTQIVYDDIKPSFITEIAPCPFTYNLRFTGKCKTIGYASELSEYDKIENHYEYDLTKIQQRTSWPIVIPSQLCIASEIIEHLPININVIFQFLSNYVSDGGFLLIQTPNAVALKKRVSMLMGENPFEMIRDLPVGSTLAGHIREYTMDELESAARDNGLLIYKKWCLNYFQYRSAKARLYRTICKILPSTMNDGITVIFQKFI